MLSQRSSMPKKKKSYWSVSEIDPSFPLNLDGRTDGRTDGQTTDNSAVEKLRCLSAWGAKNRGKNIEPVWVDDVLCLWKFCICVRMSLWSRDIFILCQRCINIIMVKSHYRCQRTVHEIILMSCQNKADYVNIYHTTMRDMSGICQGREWIQNKS